MLETMTGVAMRLELKVVSQSVVDLVGNSARIAASGALHRDFQEAVERAELSRLIYGR